MNPRRIVSTSIRAFSIIELLVVTSCVALLSALVLPAINRANSDGQGIACEANLRQMGIASQMYVDQWNCYPGNAATLPDGRSFSIWQPRLMTDMQNNPAVFYCPDEPASEEWWDTFVTVSGGEAASSCATIEDVGFGYNLGEELLSIPRYTSEGRYANFSYGYNVWGTEIGRTPQLGLGTGAYLIGGQSDSQPDASEVADPEGMIEITDREYFADLQYPYAYEVWPSRPDINPPSNVHSGDSNVLFCDGHVAAYSQRRLTELNRGDGPDAIAMNMMWNIDHHFHRPF